MYELSLFERLFPIGMILLPLLTSLSRPSPYASAQQCARHAQFKRWLVAGTLVCLGVAIALWYVRPDMARFAWILVFFLSPLSIRVAQLRHPEVGLAQQRDRRTATLAPREAALPRAASALHWGACGLWLIVLVINVVGLSRNGWIDAWLLVFQLFALLWLMWSRHFAMRSQREPEPLPENPGADIINAYERFRRVRQWLWIVLGITAMLAFALPPTILAWQGQDGLRLAVWIGAGGGALGGLAGGLFGAWADHRRVALARGILESEPE